MLWIEYDNTSIIGGVKVYGSRWHIGLVSCSSGVIFSIDSKSVRDVSSCVRYLSVSVYRQGRYGCFIVD